jgi:superfamily II DNA/RNA helicase
MSQQLAVNNSSAAPENSQTKSVRVSEWNGGIIYNAPVPENSLNDMVGYCDWPLSVIKQVDESPFNDNAPTMLQAQAWPIINMGRDVISFSNNVNDVGDIMAVFVPIIMRVLQNYPAVLSSLDPGPKALILTTSPQAVLKMENELKHLDLHPLNGLNIAFLYGKSKEQEEVRMLRSNNKPNVIIGTPCQILTYRRELHLSDVEFVAILGWNEANAKFEIPRILHLGRKEKQVVMMTNKRTAKLEAFVELFMKKPTVLEVFVNNDI